MLRPWIRQFNGGFRLAPRAPLSNCSAGLQILRLQPLRQAPRLHTVARGLGFRSVHSSPRRQFTAWKLLRWPGGVSVLLSAAAVLSPVESEEEEEEPNETREMQIFHGAEEMSEQERADAWRWPVLASIARYVMIILDPVITCVRVAHLVALFLPVLLTMPMVLLGPRLRLDKDSDRKGAVLWYSYLTWTMELAGPSFIKVYDHEEYVAAWVTALLDMLVFSLICHEVRALLEP